MTAKRIRVSNDSGSTWWTLPGSQGDKTTERNKVTDTIFGQDYESQFSALGQGQITANSFFKGVAGYVAKILQSGTSTAMASEACALVSGKTYKISAAAKQVIDFNSTITVKDGAADVTAQVLNIDYLFGMITFKPTYTVVDSITVTGNYLPMAVLARGNSFTLSQSTSEQDNTFYETAQANNGFRDFDYGIHKVSLDVGRLIQTTAHSLLASLKANSVIIIELAPSGDNTKVAYRGFFQLSSDQESGNNGESEKESVKFDLYVYDGALLQSPSKWVFGASSGLNQAIQNVLNAYQNKADLKIQYLEDGATGQQADCIVTEASLSNTVEGLNEFKFTFRLTSDQTVV